MDLLRAALPRLFCERLLVETFGRDEDWLFTVVLRLGRLARCAEAFVLVLRTGVACCVRVGVLLLWFTAGLELRWTLGVDRFWRAGATARFVVLRGLLPVPRTEFVFGVVARVRVAGVADSRARLVLFGRTASRVPFVRVASVLRPLAERTFRLSFARVAAPRVALEVPRLSAARDAAVRPLVARLPVRTVAASATRAGRADERLLRSTSGR